MRFFKTSFRYPKLNATKRIQSDYGTANGERIAAIVDEAGERRPCRIGWCDPEGWFVLSRLVALKLRLVY
jgi:hypothetical protein